MERLYYSNDSLVTGTAIARALLEYARALATKESSATVEIPIRRADGTVGRAHLLLGPASQIVSESIDGGPEDELTDEALVREFAAATARLAPTKPVPTEQPSVREAAEQTLDYDPDATEPL